LLAPFVPLNALLEPVLFKSIPTLPQAAENAGDISSIGNTGAFMLINRNLFNETN
jgi:hypothetical protein